MTFSFKLIINKPERFIVLLTESNGHPKVIRTRVRGGRVKFVFTGYYQ